MREVLLQRFCSGPDGTFGRLLGLTGEVDGGTAPIYTVEREWLDNAPRVSCIPAGVYVCGPRRFHRGGYNAIEVRDVPGRTHILFHRANLARELAGCIAPGLAIGPVGEEWGVQDSMGAWRRLMGALRGQEFRLDIFWAPSG